MNGFAWTARRYFIAGCATSFALVAAFGAGRASVKPVVSPPVVPRYTIQCAAGAASFITDNQTNTLYVYENQADASVLRTIVDLNEVGKPRLTSKVVDPRTPQDHSR